MPPKPTISQDEFAFLLRRAGLNFNAAQIADMYPAYAYVEQMVASVRKERPIDAEPAQVFAPAPKAE